MTRASREEHLRRLEEVLNRLQAHGFRLKKSKCFFLRESVDYLGHRVDVEGIRALPEAVVKAPLHTSTTLLLGLIWLPSSNMWTAKCSQAVEKSKQLLTTSNVLTHYDSTLPLRLAADASPVRSRSSHLSRVARWSGEAYRLRLALTEKNYSQIDKEALGLVYGVRKFYTTSMVESLRW